MLRVEAVEPLFPCVLLRQVRLAEETYKGLHLPGMTQEVKSLMEVIAVPLDCNPPPGSNMTPIRFKKGDFVLLEPYAGMQLEGLEAEVFLVNHEDIRAMYLDKPEEKKA